MNFGQLIPFIICLILYFVIERKALSRTARMNKGIAWAICGLSLLIWAYYTSRLPMFYPSVLLEDWLDPVIPFGPLME